MNEPCHIYQWIVTHVWKLHVTYVNKSCNTQQRLEGLHHEHVVTNVVTNDKASVSGRSTCTNLISNINLIRNINESCHTYEWVMSHIWMSHVTHMDESCLISISSGISMFMPHVWVMSHIVGVMLHTWVMCVCQIYHSAALIWGCVTWLIHICHMYAMKSCHICEWVMSHILISIHICHMYAMTHSYVCHDSFISMPWLIRKRKCHTYEWVMVYIWMSPGTHMNDSKHVWHYSQDILMTVAPCHMYEWCMSHI